MTREVKSQAALEFLLTYGWAIMVVLVAIGALSYFGVLSPDNFVPRRCALEPGIGCMDFKVQENSVTLILRNGRGEDITIDSIEIRNCTGTASGLLRNGEQNTYTISGCGNIINKKYIGDVNITYTGETSLTHKNRGNVVGKVEAGGVFSSGPPPVTNAGYTDILIFDNVEAFGPSIIHVAGDVYVIAYEGPDTDGFLKTVEIAADGQITDTIIDTLEFDAVDGMEPNIIFISSGVYAIAYRGPDSDGFLKTVEIAADGQITDTIIDTLEFDAGNGREPNILKVANDIYVVAYQGPASHAFLKTVEIAADGQITDTIIDTLEFDVDDGLKPNIIHVAGDVYAIAYEGLDNDGFLKTVEIAANGQITDAVIDTLEFDADDGLNNNIFHISNDVYAIAYTGLDDDGFLKTVEIAANGQITDTEISSLEFEDNVGRHPDLISISGNNYAIAYQGPGSDSFLTKVEIASNGQITEPVLAILKFNTNDGKDPDIIYISGNIYALVFRDNPPSGVLITFDMTIG